MLDVNIQSYWILAFECWCYIRNLLVTIIEHQTRQLFIVWCTSPTSVKRRGVHLATVTECGRVQPSKHAADRRVLQQLPRSVLHSPLLAA